MKPSLKVIQQVATDRPSPFVNNPPLCISRAFFRDFVRSGKVILFTHSSRGIVQTQPSGRRLIQATEQVVGAAQLRFAWNGCDVTLYIYCRGVDYVCGDDTTWLVIVAYFLPPDI